MSDEKVVLDHDDLRRTLVRIAHEIVEKNEDSDRLALVGIHTRGAVICRRLHALVGELSGAEVPLGDLDISFYRDDIERREPRDAPVVHDSHLDFDLAGRTIVLVDDVLYTGRTVRAAIDALFDYGRPARVQLAVLVDRGHRELPIRPDYVGKNLPTAPGERVNVRLEETDGADEVAITPADAAAAEGGRMKHLLGVERPLTRGDRAHPRARAELRRGRPARHQEGADPAGAHHRQPLLRGEHPHALLLRAGGQAPLRGRGQRQVGRLLGRQGRVAEGHGRDALRLRPGGDRDPLAARRRRRAGGPLDRGLGDQRRRRQARASDARPCSTSSPSAQRLDSLEGTKIWIVGDVLHSRVARSCLLAFRTMGAQVTLCGPPTLIPRGIESLGCEVSYDLDGLGEADVVYALRMQRERMSESFVPSLREYASRYQIDSRRLGPRQLLMHPGPVNRGVELSPEVIDSPQSLITAQVESGLVVRMAILYELLAGSDRARPDRGPAPADTPTIGQPA